MAMKDWSRGDKIAFVTLIVAVLGTIAAWVVVPEFRKWARLDKSDNSHVTAPIQQVKAKQEPEPRIAPRPSRVSLAPQVKSQISKSLANAHSTISSTELERPRSTTTPISTITPASSRSSPLLPGDIGEGCTAANEKGECTKYEFRVRFGRIQTGKNPKQWEFDMRSLPSKKKVLIQFTGEIIRAEGVDERTFFVMRGEVDAKDDACDPAADLCLSSNPSLNLQKETRTGSQGELYVRFRLTCQDIACACENGSLTISVQQ